MKKKWRNIVKLASVIVLFGVLCLPKDVQAKNVVYLKAGQTKELALSQGDTKKLAVRKPKGKVRWFSGKKTVVKVNKKGKITALKKGVAVITAKTSKNTYLCVVKVTQKEKEEQDMEITVTVGNSVYAAKLYNNQTTQELVKRFPMTITMSELNGNEKYQNLSSALPSNAQKVAGIHTGDLKLFGEDCLVLFYKDFSTGYRYTSLGYLENPEQLAQDVGTGTVKVTFALK